MNNTQSKPKIDWADEIETRYVKSPEFVAENNYHVTVGRVTKYRHLSGRERWEAFGHDSVYYGSFDNEPEAIDTVMGFARELRNHLGDRWWCYTHEPEQTRRGAY